MSILLPAAPAVTDQRNDQSGFVSSNGSSVSAMCGYSLKGPLKPTLLTTTAILDSKFGRPSPKVSYSHYGARRIINAGYPVFYRRVVNGATYGGVAVLSDPTHNSVIADQYPDDGSPFSAEPDPSTGIAPNGPGYILLTFNGPLVTSNTVNMNIVLDSQIVAISPVAYSGSNDATLAAVAAAINSAMAPGGTDGKAVVIDADPSSNTNARAIGIYAPSGQQIAITSVTVSGGVSQAAVTQQTPLVYIQPENPGAWSRGVGFKFTNADVGSKEVINMTFSNSVGSVASLTVTINGVACTPVSNTTPSDAFLAAVATAIQSHPDVDTATVVQKPLGNDNDRIITIRMLRGSSTDTVITHAFTGSIPTISYLQQIKGVSPTGAFDLEVYTSDNPTAAAEVHRVAIATQVDDMGAQQQISYVVNQGANSSDIIRVISNAPDDGSVVIPFDPVTGDIMSTIQWLSAGSDGALPTASQIAEAYLDFEDTNLYQITTLVNVGYTAAAVQQAMRDVAKKRNDGTEAILDIPPEYQKSQAMAQYRLTQMPIDSEYAAAYYPDCQAQDPYTGVNLWVPNSAHVAVVYANNDAARGIGKAPAGLRVGQVDTSALRYEYKDEEHDMLFNLQLNPIRRVGSAFYVMGDTTLQYAQSALSFVSVARLVGFLQGRVRSRAQFYLFEGNTDVNAFSLVTDLNNFLEPWKSSGDLNDYLVVSKIGVNNTNGIIEQGNRIVDVILDPVRSMRRILVRTTITATGGVASIEVSQI